MVTAELALALPALVAVATMLAWLISLGVGQARLDQAAREAARAAARGDSAALVRATAHQIAPGAQVVVSRSGDRVHVSVRTAAVAPIAVLRPWSRALEGTADAWRE